MVAARFPPFVGGIETHVKEVAKRMVARGHAVTVLTADPGNTLARRECVDGIDVLRVRSVPRGKDWCLAPGIFHHVRALSNTRASDIVHVQGFHTLSAPLAMLGAVNAAVPFVLTFHSGGHSSRVRNGLRRPQAYALAPLARRADALVAVSRYEADRFSTLMGIDRGRFTVVPNGASLPRPSECAVDAAADRPLIVSLGRLERYKGHHRAIAAFALLRQQMPDARLRILGEGPYLSSLREIASRYGVADAVEIGAVPAADRDAMASILSQASLVVLLSDYEAHPVAVMEALSLQRRVLATHTSGFCELADLGLIKTVALSASPQQIAEAMAGEMALAGNVVSTPLPDWDECTSQLLSIYRRARAGAIR